MIINRIRSTYGTRSCDIMPTSMTGFGQKSIAVNETTISVEIKTVNHRFLDIAVKLPTNYQFMEHEIKKVLQHHFKRGRIECSITVDQDQKSKAELQVNWELMNQYINILRTIQRNYDFSLQEGLAIMPEVSEIIAIETNNEVVDGMQDVMLKAVEVSCNKAVEMRVLEGEAMSTDIMNRMKNIKQIIKQLGDRRETVIMEYRDRMLDRLRAVTDQQIDDLSRFYQEIAILAEKGDITEEIIRLESHVQQFIDSLQEGQLVGRKLEFILQEMQREINTIGSKSNDILLSKWVVSLKTNLEKIKEQIQNIE